jgi:short-subunit dehydrogenase
MSAFREHYGPWAVVAGASVGLGEAFARQLARGAGSTCCSSRAARRPGCLAADLRSAHGIEVRTWPRIWRGRIS